VALAHFGVRSGAQVELLTVQTVQAVQTVQTVNGA
jgi:hypothetical protein